MQAYRAQYDPFEISALAEKHTVACNTLSARVRRSHCTSRVPSLFFKFFLAKFLKRLLFAHHLARRLDDFYPHVKKFAQYYDVTSTIMFFFGSPVRA